MPRWLPLGDGLGPTSPMPDVTGELLGAWFRAGYADVAPTTWNRELATLRSPVAWWQAKAWLPAQTAPAP